MIHLLIELYKTISTLLLLYDKSLDEKRAIEQLSVIIVFTNSLPTSLSLIEKQLYTSFFANKNPLRNTKVGQRKIIFGLHHQMFLAITSKAKLKNYNYNSGYTRLS